MKSFLIPIGDRAVKALPSVLAAQAMGAAPAPASPRRDLQLLALAPHAPDPMLSAIVRDLNDCHALFSSSGQPAADPALFPWNLTFTACTLPLTRQLQSVCQDSSGLLAALRGKGMPLSLLTDWEAIEWTLTSLLEDEALCASSGLSQLLRPLQEAAGAGESLRVLLLFDPLEPFAAGVTLPLLQALRTRLSRSGSSLELGLVGLVGEAVRPDSEQAVSLNRLLSAIDQRRLLPETEPGQTSGADVFWLLSLPASMVRGADSLRLLSVAAARVAASFLAGDKRPAPGFHARRIPGIVSLSALGQEAGSAAGVILAAVWLLSDLLPSLRDDLEHPTLLRAIGPNARHGFFRKLLRQDGELSATAAPLVTLDRTLRFLASEALSLLRALPEPLRAEEPSLLLWQAAVNACGRVATLAAEERVSREEARASGIDQVKPVHRVSLADTEEEAMLRRLDETASRLAEEKRRRADALAELGGYRALQALADCLRKCEEAREKAGARLEALQAETGADPLALGKQERRVRLLDAAIAATRTDLAAWTASPALSAAPAHPLTDSLPYAGEVLTPACAEALQRLLTAPADQEEAARKESREHLPDLFVDFRLSDGKALFRELTTLCDAEPQNRQGSALALLLSAAMSLCLKTARGARFPGRQRLPDVWLLPDVVSTQAPVTLRDCLALLPPSGLLNQEPHLRGLLAFLLLRQYRRAASAEASLKITPVTADAGLVARCWLRNQGRTEASIASLVLGEEQAPMAILLSGQLPLSARPSPSWAQLMPPFATWFDAEHLCFLDPVGFLGQSDRLILSERLRVLLSALEENPASPLIPFLSDFLRLLEAPEAAEADARDRGLSMRLRAVCGLLSLPAYQETLRRMPSSYEHMLPEDTLLSALSGLPAVPASVCDVPEDAVYTWKGIPFARESASGLLDAIHVPEETHVLATLDRECDLLADASDDYCDAFCAGVSALLDRYPDADPDAAAVAHRLLKAMQRPLRSQDTELTWPWDPAAPSVRTILTEALDASLSASASQPFSDVLTLFPARESGILGDALLAEMCMIPGAEPAEPSPEAPVPVGDSALPPLSAAFAGALCATPEGQTLLQPGLLRLERLPEGAFRVTLTLEGSFTLRLIRVYAAEEVLRLYADDLPTLALWPSMPFPPESWRAYFVYAHLPASCSLSVLTQGAEGFTEVPPEAGRSVTRFAAFPRCFALSREGRSMGALPHLLPEPSLADRGPVCACVDLGSVGSSVVLASARGREPMHGPCRVRTLLSHPVATPELLRREFLPAVPVTALLPSVVQIFRNAPGEDPVPFRDGIILMAASLQDVVSLRGSSLYTSLKWEDEKGRSVALCLHQLMLMAALQARAEGASALSWRFAVPDAMALDGQNRWIALCQSLAATVSAESGLPAPANEAPVRFASESAAVGAYFRFCAPEDTRGGFMTLDLGACTADISLFLRGREQAIRTVQLPLGFHYMLLPSLLSAPDLLQQDFGYLPDPALQQELQLMTGILRDAARDPSALRFARLALDTLVADRFPVLLSAAAERRAASAPSRTGALLLLYASYLMMISGLILLQIAADPGKNEFLPEQMTLCLAGRGAGLLEALSPGIKGSLWHFLTMFRNRRVASLALLFSSEKKMEIPVGLSLLPHASDTLPESAPEPAAIGVRPEELLPEFINRFCQEFPAEAALLFPGFFSGDPYHPLTPYGDALVSASLSAAFGETRPHHPYDSLVLWLSGLLDLIRENPPR